MVNVTGALVGLFLFTTAIALKRSRYRMVYSRKLDDDKKQTQASETDHQ